MATCYWTGAAADNSWNSNGNWSGVVPVNDDTVIFDGRVTTDANRNCTVGMDQSAVHIDYLRVMPSYTGTIGAANGPLKIGVDVNSYIGGSGDYYIQCAQGAADFTIPDTTIDSSGIVGLSSQKNAVAGNVSKWNIVKVVRGTVYFYGLQDIADTGAEAGTCVSILYISPTSGRGAKVAVTIGDGCSDNKNTVNINMFVLDGTVTCYSEINILYQFGGTVNIGGTTYDMDDADDDCTTLNLFDGTLAWEPTDTAATPDSASPSPTIGTVRVFGGTFDASGMLKKGDTTRPTISVMELYPGATANMDNGVTDSDSILISTLRKFGGTLKSPPLKSYTLS